MLRKIIPWLASDRLDGKVVARWAGQAGWRFRKLEGHSGWSLEGRLVESACRVELGDSHRPYIEGQELRVKVDINVDATISAMVLDRGLQEALESLAFADLTDSLQTAVTSVLPEEVRWTAMFSEYTVSADGQFTTRFASIGDNREKTTGWVAGPLENALMRAAQQGLLEGRPFLIMLMRGRLYARVGASGLSQDQFQFLLALIELAAKRARQLFVL